MPSNHWSPEPTPPTAGCHRQRFSTFIFPFLLTFLPNLPLHSFSFIFLILFKRPEQNTKITLETLPGNRAIYSSLFPSKSITSFRSSPIKSESS